MKELEKFYIEYGKFIIHFENINFTLCYIIRIICTNHNLFSEGDKKIEILLEGLTANPLLSKFNSIFQSTELSKDNEIVKLVGLFQKNFQNVIEFRNFIAHGTFFPGDSLANMSNFEVRKPKLSKKGYKQNVNTITIESFKKFNNDIYRLEKFINDFSAFIRNNTPEEFKEKVLIEMKNSILDLKVNLEILNTSVELE